MNFTFNPITYETYKPQINYIKNFFKKHHITNPSLETCFQTSMTLLSGPVETIKDFSTYLYYSIHHAV